MVFVYSVTQAPRQVSNAHMTTSPQLSPPKANFSVAYPAPALHLSKPQSFGVLDSEDYVMQMLEIARDSNEAYGFPEVKLTLERAIGQIWGRIASMPNSYVMSPTEFAVFNFFQHRFVGDQIAAAARARYWDYREMPA
ncbi:hypothetical protein GGS23DRAFT_578879 [Durotheca rogersii]|uniref:uncharacterized protein n=1 Tax=Durotheca rogersii TaxID=419775 RepID=UPI00222127C4|nr:uncharacterized protein GGS23DRAFT_578879 [Durotheca rogersii]KAI5860786.1 hypothetical protein GGS23DRAFT_578879 [Durotheca rogersii]